MKVDDIQKYADDGKYSEAYSALEEILSLGPQNTNALKLKAQLLSCEGKFSEEAQVWRKILSIDQEDEAATDYFQRTMMEQREHEFFSDLLPTGGIRFLTSSRSVETSFFIGIIGCALFLIMTNFSRRFPVLATPTISYICFGLFVVLPWLLILFFYFRSLKDITIDKDAIILRTRTYDYRLRWEDLANFYLLRRHTKKGCYLFIMLVPKQSNYVPVLINIGGNSVVRAPSFLVREITRMFHEPTYEILDNVKTPKKPTIFS